MSRRKCTRYPERQLVSCSAPSAPAGSTGRSASATTARPSADVLRRPSADAGKTTPALSPLPVALPFITAGQPPPLAAVSKKRRGFATSIVVISSSVTPRSRA